MRRIPKTALAIAAGVTILTACGERKPVATPKPTAYARIALYDTTYAPVEGAPVNFEANSAVSRHLEPARDNDLWLDLGYPAYKGSLHITFSAAADSAKAAEVVANRSERMALNLGDNSAEQTTLEAGGFTTTVIATTGRTLTPVQFVSVGPGWVISGAFTLEREPTSGDSISPVIEAVKIDIIHAAKCLR